MPGKHIKVLLIEDNPTDVLLVRATLAASSHTPFVVTDAGYLRSAVDLMKSDSFDVILLDLGLPDAQGLETFDRAQAGAGDVPIIVLSGLGDERVAMRAVNRGAQDFLPKAEGLDGLLVRSIRYAIERNRARLALRRSALELRRKNRELIDELRMAREIQQALLPHNYPVFSDNEKTLHFAHCYRPATSLSGDFFTILRLADHKAGVLICDVMGHGVRAALIGTLARGLVDQFIPIAEQPGQFLASINHELSLTFKKGGIDAFATAFYFVADLHEQRLTYANAGHPHALVVRRDENVVDWLPINGRRKPPLGLLNDTEYSTFESRLCGHDSIFLFTDGLFEAENHHGESFGRGRLLDAVSERRDLPCELLLDELVHESQRFAGREDFMDDVCLVGMDVISEVAVCAA